MQAYANSCICISQDINPRTKETEANESLCFSVIHTVSSHQRCPLVKTVTEKAIVAGRGLSGTGQKDDSVSDIFQATAGQRLACTNSSRLPESPIQPQWSLRRRVGMGGGHGTNPPRPHSWRTPGMGLWNQPPIHRLSVSALRPETSSAPRRC